MMPFDPNETAIEYIARLESSVTKLVTALKAARLVLVERGLFEDSRIILTIDAALS